jgi:hypothetical protein
MKLEHYKTIEDITKELGGLSHSHSSELIGQSLIPRCFAFSVNIVILNIKRQGWVPFCDVLNNKEELCDLINSDGMNLLYPSNEEGEEKAKKLNRLLVFTVAVLAFNPGGIEMFGIKFKATLE